MRRRRPSLATRTSSQSGYGAPTRRRPGRPAACWRMLVSASITTRYAEVDDLDREAVEVAVDVQPGQRPAGRGELLQQRARAPRTPASGASGASGWPSGSRSTPTIRRIDAIVSAPACSICSSASSTRFGSCSAMNRAPCACTTMPVTWWAMKSCRSRANSARCSARTASNARSAGCLDRAQVDAASRDDRRPASARISAEDDEDCASTAAQRNGSATAAPISRPPPTAQPGRSDRRTTTSSSPSSADRLGQPPAAAAAAGDQRRHRGDDSEQQATTRGQQRRAATGPSLPEAAARPRRGADGWPPATRVSGQAAGR